MIINNARGSHSSPGVYTKEVDVKYSVKSLGITSLGLAGETVKGPAFEPIKIEKWSDFTDYFGPTSTEKVKATGAPKYELPYIAKEYLKESKQLYVCRTLGLSGYDAGPAFVIYATVSGETSTDTKSYPVAVLRSKAKYTSPSGDNCSGQGDELEFLVTSVTLTTYETTDYKPQCDETTANSGVSSSDLNVVTPDNLGKFTLVVNSGSTAATKYGVSLNLGDKDYIYNVFGTTPFSNDTPLFVEEVYDYALMSLAESAVSGNTEIDDCITITGDSFTTSTVQTAFGLADYRRPYSYAWTPWLVSQLDIQKVGEGTAATFSASAKRLFRIYTLSDGDNANTEIKVSIEKINPATGTFDLSVRAMNDTDAYPVVLEKFVNCTLTPGSKNYLPLKVGSFDGTFELKSKFIAIEMSESEDLHGAVPCGFEGYMMHNITTFNSGLTNIDIAYNTTFNKDIKAKRQYFGLSNITGIDTDFFSFKGEKNLVMSNGFHMDSILGVKDLTGVTAVTVDGEDVRFTTVDPNTDPNATKIPRILNDMTGSLYEDINTRKFTVCFYGGFDGWDIYRKERTNTNDFKGSKYTGATYKKIGEASSAGELDFLRLPVGAIDSDYYAYLGAYRLFSNPEDVDINVFATPGIDWEHNELLVEDALDMIEDPDDGRGGDALYVVSAPNSETPEDVVSALEGTSIDSSYATTYWPWVKFFDSDANVYINLPVTKDVVRNLAYVDNTSYPWFAPAGVNRGNVNAVRATFKTRLGDEDKLYDGRINPVKTFAADGIKIWGNKTMYTIDSPLNRVNVRRLMLRIKKLIKNVGKQLIFDQYDSSLKNQFMSLVTPILSNVKANGGIYDYVIEVDDSVEARDAHTLPCTIHVKPTPTLEYIDLTFTIYPESVDFNF